MKIIASWGSSGSGKTTLALAIAAELAKRKKDVLIISTDTRTPLLPVALPTVKGIDGRNSIGTVFAGQEITDATLKDKIVRHPKSSHIYVMGYASGEQPALTYTPPSRDGATALFSLLSSSPFHYLIVDCDSSAIFDHTTLAAIELADIGLLSVTPDVKGYEYRKSATAWLTGNDVFHAERFVRVASPVMPYTPLAGVRALFGGFDVELPFVQSVAEKMMAGELIGGLDGVAGVRYMEEIRKIADRIEKE